MPALRIPYHVVVEELPALAEHRCRHCGDPLDLSQPDPDRPDLGIGCCLKCDCICLLLPDRLQAEIDPTQLALMARTRFAALRRGQARQLMRPPDQSEAAG